MKNSVTRKKIIFYGLVQGVGFRWKAAHTADALGLTGWVLNDYDGSVLMEVQGAEAMIDRMLQDLNRDLYIEIQELSIRSIPVVEEERSFQIKD